MKRKIIEFKKLNLHYGLKQKSNYEKLVNIFNKKKKINTKNYHALKNISFDIYEGEMVGLIGPSGSGKTSILKLISGEEKISSGTMNIAGKDVSKFSPTVWLKYRRRLSMIFQDYDLISSQTVVKNILNYKIPTKDFLSRLFVSFSYQEKLKVYKKLDELGILDVANKKVFELSGGQKQRVAIARATLQNSKLFLADEPVSALDPNMASEVMELLRSNNINSKITTVVNLHHIEMAIKYTDRIIGVNNGKIIFNDRTKNITLKDLEKIYGKKINSFTEKTLVTYKKENKNL